MKNKWTIEDNGDVMGFILSGKTDFYDEKGETLFPEITIQKPLNGCNVEDIYYEIYIRPEKEKEVCFVLCFLNKTEDERMSHSFVHRKPAKDASNAELVGAAISWAEETIRGIHAEYFKS